MRQGRPPSRPPLRPQKRQEKDDHQRDELSEDEPISEGKILVVDDELSMREVLEIFLTQRGYEVVLVSDPSLAKKRIMTEGFDLILTDLRMPYGGGLAVLDDAKRHQPETPTVVMTAFASTETAIEAMKKGAHDYLTKPFKLDALELILHKALNHRKLLRENARLKESLKAQERFEGLLGRSEAMQHIFELIRRVAPAKTPILIMGESGTGKEMVAHAIHAQSARSDEPFVALNCAALPEHLMESELFGHRKGAFTGADQHKPGLFQAAHHGTLFLDEIGEMPLSMQAKVLRALQEQKVKEVGSWEEIEVDLRVIAATNRPLLKEVQAGRFREDLYYRLNVIPITLPPLRDRPSDISLLTDHFIQRYAREFNKEINGISPTVMNAIIQSPLSGNVRELKNLVERAVALSSGGELDAQDFLWDTPAPQMVTISNSESTRGDEHRSSNFASKRAQAQRSEFNPRVPTQMRQDRARRTPPTHDQEEHTPPDLKGVTRPIEATSPIEGTTSEDTAAIDVFIRELDVLDPSNWRLDDRLSQIEIALITEALRRSEGNKTEAAKHLGVSFRSFRYRLQKLNLESDPGQE